MSEPTADPSDFGPECLPVSVLTGFLGSGKATLLRHLLRQPDLAGTAVIIDEFGEIGLDHLLVESSNEDMLLLSSGCLCCTIRGDSIETLRLLYKRRAKGEVPPFGRVVIETTGLADPAPILHTLMQDPMLSSFYRLDGVITTVDAVHGIDQLDRQMESVKQAAVADRIVLTKQDLSAMVTSMGPSMTKIMGGSTAIAMTIISAPFACAMRPRSTGANSPIGSRC